MDTPNDAAEIANDDRQPLDGTVEALVASEMADNNEQGEKEPANSPNKDKIGGAQQVNETTETETAKGQPAQDEYAQHITYNDKGVAIYTEPVTHCRYEFDNASNQWVPLKSDVSDQSVQGEAAATADNPYENEHYRWCHESNQWILKEQTGEQASSATADENEFYKWDDEKQQWIPKTTSHESVSEYKDGVHTYTDKDGVVFFWDTEKNAWFPQIDDDFMAIYQMNYGFVDNTSDSAKKEVPSSSQLTAGDAKADQEEKAVAGSKRRHEPPKWFETPPELNTKVYVTNLPLDITQDEFIEVMSKCGMIVRDQKTNKMKVKLYAEPDGQLKGDGLCHYFKVESVDLAVNILDGYDVRGHKIRVQRAQFQMKGDYNPALRPKKSKKDKEKEKKLQEKLFEWRPEKMRGERVKHERTVIIKNLFTPELFDKEVHLILEYQNDLREECKKCGTVRKVIIYDRHAEGVAQISMGDPEEADLVIQMMNGRYFGQRKLTAETWDGKTKYKIYESEAEASQRLNKWDEFLKEPDTTTTDDTKDEVNNDNDK